MSEGEAVGSIAQDIAVELGYEEGGDVNPEEKLQNKSRVKFKDLAKSAWGGLKEGGKIAKTAYGEVKSGIGFAKGVAKDVAELGVLYQGAKAVGDAIIGKRQPEASNKVAHNHDISIPVPPTTPVAPIPNPWTAMGEAPTIVINNPWNALQMPSQAPRHARRHNFSHYPRVPDHAGQHAESHRPHHRKRRK